ncbi:CCR4-NOT transcription complex subunit 10-like isoform X1 [Telopea speciosissima]|uniref:CCR4-NOT transcription complex subunit 10-like isoform X1 n=1 Tax=Telopea speciosissima TaxID=54955 RepID=UPI001CC7B651|nr:CCR4-NOT transcription complex subunit 10-like isoform X1 [Telopea speciosissima]
MDSRDLSSSATASRDGSSAEEDGLLSVTAGLAKEAALLFQSGRYTECIDLLNQLLQKKEDDPKVLHNIAVAEYFRDGCYDPRKLLDVLNKVKMRSEELARASGDQVEVSSNLGNNVVSGSKGSTVTQHQFSAANSSSIAYTDESDTSVATLNTAVILFHLHEYSNALSVLEPLYQNIEPIDETTALHICLLLLDVALALHDASKAADVIQYLEKAFGVGYMIGQGDNGSTNQHQSSNAVVRPQSAPSNSTPADASNSDSAANSNSSENPLTRTISDEALESLLSTLDSGGQNLTRPVGLPSNDLLRTSTDRPVPGVDLKLKLHLYKVRHLLLTRNLKATKREVKLAMNIARGRDSSMALLLKSQLEYARGNHRKAIKLLMTSSNKTESGIASIFNNNLGCIYHQLWKHHTSTMFFSKALRSSSSLRSEKPLKLSTFSQDKSLHIVYNCGLQYLSCGKPIIAARCFQKASLVFHNRPLLWLRFAECCLLALEKGLLKSSESPTNGEEVRVHVVGNGKWRQLLVEDGISRNRYLDPVEEEDGLLGGDGQHRLSISFARQCLLNALHLLNSLELKYLNDGLSNSATEEDDSSQSGSLKNSNSKNLLVGDSKASNVAVVSASANANGDAKEARVVSLNNTLQSSVSAYEDMCKRENHWIKQAVLADLAYVELNLENPLKALSAANSLLKIPECSKIYIFLGHIYAAEALCCLNRAKEAAEHLSVYVSDGNVELPFSEEDKKWQVERGGDGEELNGGSVAASYPSMEDSQGIMFLKPEEAHGTLYVNLAAMSAMQGDLEQAHRFVTEALYQLPNNPQAVLTAVYVDLLLQKTQAALAKLKQYSHVRFIPSNVTFNSCA